MKYFLQKRIQNPIKHLRWRVKRAIIDVWQRSKYASDLPLIFKKYLVQTNSNLYKAPRSYLPSSFQLQVCLSMYGLLMDTRR